MEWRGTKFDLVAAVNQAVPDTDLDCVNILSDRFDVRLCLTTDGVMSSTESWPVLLRHNQRPIVRHNQIYSAYGFAAVMAVRNAALVRLPTRVPVTASSNKTSNIPLRRS